MKKSTLFILIIILAIFLRIYRLDSFPPSLYTDEANQGYNAYSILLTGRDEHGVFLPVSLRSFGDWKPPLPTYLMIPFIYLLGLGEVAVRLPSAICGLGTVVLTFFLTKELFKGKKEVAFISLLSSFFLSISPWHILQSRSAMLVMISLFFLEAGIYSFIKAKDNPRWLYLSTSFFVLSIYSYYGMRVIAPLMAIYLLFFYRKKLISLRKELIISGMICFILLSPLIFGFFQNSDVVLGRARTVSVFYDQGVKLRQWELITQDGISYPAILARLFHNSIYMYGRDIIKRFLSHFEGQFLFLTGDKSPPFQIPNMGVLYLLDGIFIILGLVFLYKKKHAGKNLLIFWFLVSFIPAAFTFMTPSSNRTFSAVAPFVIFVSLGILYLSVLLEKSRQGKYHMQLTGSCFKVLIPVLYVLSFAFFLNQYFIVLPRNHTDWWNYGLKDVVKYVQLVESNYDAVIVPESIGMPYIYFLFYGRYDPDKFRKEAIRTYVTDRFGYEHVEGFGKYVFPAEFEWKYAKEDTQLSNLYIVPFNQASHENGYKKVFYYPNGEGIFKIFSYE